MTDQTEPNTWISLSNDEIKMILDARGLDICYENYEAIIGIVNDGGAIPFLKLTYEEIDFIKQYREGKIAVIAGVPIDRTVTGITAKTVNITLREADNVGVGARSEVCFFEDDTDYNTLSKSDLLESVLEIQKVVDSLTRALAQNPLLTEYPLNVVQRKIDEAFILLVGLIIESKIP